MGWGPQSVQESGHEELGVGTLSVNGLYAVKRDFNVALREVFQHVHLDAILHEQILAFVVSYSLGQGLFGVAGGCLVGAQDFKDELHCHQLFFKVDLGTHGQRVGESESQVQSERVGLRPNRGGLLHQLKSVRLEVFGQVFHLQLLDHLGSSDGRVYISWPL